MRRFRRSAGPGSFQISSDIPATLAVLNARILMKRVCQSRYAFSPEREKKLSYEGKQHAVHRVVLSTYRAARAAFRSSCSKADAMRSISPLVRPCRAASERHLETALPTCAAI